MTCPICPSCAGPYPGPARAGVTLIREDDVRADKRYYTNADRSKVVEEGDPSATFLLASEGDDITNEDVKKYGLGKAKKADEAPAAKADEAPAEVKMQAAPPENKAMPGPKASKDK